MLAAALALLALPATGWLAAVGMPSTPAGYRTLALVLAGLAFLALGGTRGPLRPLLLALAALPALALGTSAARAADALPGPAWWWVLAAAVLLGLLPRGRRAATALLVVGLGAAVVLHGGLPGLQPAAGAQATPAAPTPPREGVRRGAPVRAGGAVPLGAGPGPWWQEAQRGRHPGPRPVVLVLAGARPDAGGWLLPQATVVHDEGFAFGSAHELRPFDVVVVMEGAWGVDTPDGRARATAVAGFVRGGGLLIGPAPAGRWPPHLGPLLREAARGRASGTADVRRLGLGRVARAAHQEDVAAIFAADLWVRPVHTALLDLDVRPAPLSTWTPWTDVPAERRTQGVLLLLHALALAVFARLLPGGGAQALGTLLVTGAVLVALVWSAPDDPGFRVEGAFVDLGGAGGRRIEGVWINAGPGGWRGHVRFEGSGVVAHRGGTLDDRGRLHVEPGASAWVVRERRSPGPEPAEREDRRQGAVLELLRGRLDPRRLRLVRVPALPVRVEGAGPVGAAGVEVR